MMDGRLLTATCRLLVFFLHPSRCRSALSCCAHPLSGSQQRIFRSILLAITLMPHLCCFWLCTYVLFIRRNSRLDCFCLIFHTTELISSQLGFGPLYLVHLCFCTFTMLTNRSLRDGISLAQCRIGDLKYKEKKAKVDLAILSPSSHSSENVSNYISITARGHHLDHTTFVVPSQFTKASHLPCFESYY